MAPKTIESSDNQPNRAQLERKRRVVIAIEISRGNHVATGFDVRLKRPSTMNVESPTTRSLSRSKK
jgi:hypothetical protein